MPGLFRIATDLSHMRVQAVLNSPDTSGVRAGDAATVAFEGHTMVGTVLEVHEPSPDPAAA